MRIQHNIPALNSYRNYSNNVSKVSKNLEKLSTGYKINRAGDDAAGLAISEKMRIQVTGLEQAQSNAKAGINLVQTAEGALTEVHDMLNRMYTLAEESANGTFDDSVDRTQLQKEVNQLREEIDRIADATNYNGIQLLDGSLSKNGVTSKSGPTSVDLSGLQVDMYANAKNVSAIKGKFGTNDLFANAPGVSGNTVSVDEGDKFSMTIKYNDTDGREIETTLNFTVGKAQDGTTVAGGLWLEDGSEGGTHIIDLAAANTVTAQDFTDAVENAISKNSSLKDLKSAFNVSGGGNSGGNVTAANGIEFEARVGGEGGARLKSITMSWADKDSTILDTKATWDVGFTETQLAKDEMKAINMDKAIVLDLEADGTDDKVSKNIEDVIFEVNGEKFAFIKKGSEKYVDVQNVLRDAGVTHWVELAGNNIAGADVTKMVNKIATATGLKVEQGTATINATDGTTKWAANNTGTEVLFTTREQSSSKKSSGGLRLQIGDTAQSFNMLTVEVNDMHTAAMKFTANAGDDETIRAASGMSLADVDISNQDDASKAMAVIKNATNYVSDARGTLGALQNRLDHTINNLSVAQENIQDAESNIRDVDVAKEMMAYTKNNILVQSAQAMLAQANQLPQGVLQLLG